MCYTYIVRCRDDSFYTGWCINLEQRVWEHNNSGKGAKYTKTRRPVKLVYHEEFEDKISAMKREYQIKQLTRKQKLKLIESNKQSLSKGDNNGNIKRQSF